MKYSIRNFIVQDREDDNDILHRKLFDVNIKLFNINKGYRKLILDTVSYMKKLAKKKFEDYTPAKGISGANVGIPFNIIGILNKNNKWDFFLNPEFLKKSTKKEIVKSNCGSLLLEEPIKIERHEWIELEYWNLKGKKKKQYFDDNYSYTIQHEVDHNNGILINNRKRKAV